MVEVADIFREYGPQYRKKYGARLLPSHHQAMRDIERCRTEDMGGHVYRCSGCSKIHYSYHSCRNRNCPKCMNDKADAWLQKQNDFRLPVHYHLVTFTLPADLRDIALSNQKIFYSLLFKASASAMKKLAADRRFIGGLIGAMGILHTWSKALFHHPHVHYVVPGGGFDLVSGAWRPSRKKFLVPVRALSRIFRAKFRDELKKTALFDQVPDCVWQKEWVVHSKPVGYGEKALKYLATYVFRVAITNNRIVRLSNDQVTFRCRAPDSGKMCLQTLPVMEFMRRYLTHVLPRGFIKVRYYGLLSPVHRPTLNRVKSLLGALFVLLLGFREPPKDNSPVQENTVSRVCPDCGARLILIGRVKSIYSRGPP